MPRERNPEETRRDLLRAADTLLRTRGVARVTTRDIAREAGCAEGTLYKHFATKEDLFLAVLHESLPRFEEQMEPAIAGQLPLAESLEKLVIAALRFFEQVLPYGIALLGDADLLERHRERVKKPGAGPQILYKTVAAYIEREQAQGRINPRLQPLATAALLLGPCFQWTQTKMVNGAPPLPLSERQFAHQIVATLIAGLTAPLDK